ncbi:hypothetical protein [Pseudomonas aeruginosa]|uniref:hypothetical protein n=1 Tax=Pseudomonas aeruginosa TaxID=287 RepID=UPI00115D766E|nr:hypothetical protein [Pseudomonas aeruginosa]TRM24684.1 hypothetical protein FNL72_28045 [Pseudomonas aeruginosa]
MYPPRQHFALLNPITDHQWDELPSYLASLFNKTSLVEAGLMAKHEELEFETSARQRDGGLWAFFTVAVSGCAPTENLLTALVSGFERKGNSVYTIGKPGSGYGLQPGGTVLPEWE